MNTGIAQIPVCIQGLHVMRSPYAYGDLCDLHVIPVCRMHTGIKINPRMHTGNDLDPRLHTGISCFGYGVCMLCIHKILMHVKILIQRVTRGKIADMSETDPRTHTESPHNNIIICERAGIQKNSHMGSPHTHNEIVRTWGLTHYYIHSRYSRYNSKKYLV
jgi:hypothetical protein